MHRPLPSLPSGVVVVDDKSSDLDDSDDDAANLPLTRVAGAQHHDCGWNERESYSEWLDALLLCLKVLVCVLPSRWLFQVKSDNRTTFFSWEKARRIPHQVIKTPHHLRNGRLRHGRGCQRSRLVGRNDSPPASLLVVRGRSRTSVSERRGL